MMQISTVYKKEGQREVSITLESLVYCRYNNSTALGAVQPLVYFLKYLVIQSAKV